MPTYKCQRCGNQITLSIKPGECEFCGTSQFKLIGQSPSRFVTPDSGDLSGPSSSGGSPGTPEPVSKAGPGDSFFLSKIPAPAKTKSSPSPSSSPDLVSLPLYSGPAPVSPASRPSRIAKTSVLEKLPIALSLKVLLGVLCGSIGLGGYWWWQTRYDTSEFTKTVLKENFNRPKSWALTDEASFRNGALYQSQTRRNHYGASIWMGKTFQDVDFSAEAVKTSGPNDIPYGLIARVNGKEGHRFYYLFINGQGNFVMGEHERDTWLHRVGWQANNAVNKGSRRNHLRIVVKDNLVIGFINGRNVGSFQGKDKNAGRVAVFSMRGRGASMGVYFDNVLVKERVQPAKKTK